MMLWPALLKPVNGGFGQKVRALSGGPALSGFEQIVPQMIDRWQARYQVPLRNAAQMLAMRSLLGNLRGRTGTVALPAYENRYAPWRVDPYGRRINPRFARTRDLDGSLYADAATINDTLISAHLLGSAAQAATSVVIQVTQGNAPQPGNRFSLKARLYEIGTVTPINATDFTVTIWPWLRFAASSGAIVDFTTPVCEMRLTSDDQGQDAMLELAVMKYATPVLQFEEAAPVTDDTPP